MIGNYKHNTTIIMKKFLFFTIAFLLMPLIALAKGEDEVTSYQIEGAGTGAQGSYLVKVWVVTGNKKLADDIIGRCGVHGVLFKGFSNTETRQHQKPLAGSPTVEQQHADFFNDFFADGGEYRNYVQVVSNTRTVVKSGKKYKIGATVTVSKEQLRRDLEAKGILRGLNTGF